MVKFFCVFFPPLQDLFTVYKDSSIFLSWRLVTCTAGFLFTTLTMLYILSNCPFWYSVYFLSCSVNYFSLTFCVSLLNSLFNQRYICFPSVVPMFFSKSFIHPSCSAYLQWSMVSSYDYHVYSQQFPLLWISLHIWKYSIFHWYSPRLHPSCNLWSSTQGKPTQNSLEIASWQLTQLGRGSWWTREKFAFE